MPVYVSKTCEPREYGRSYGTTKCAVSFPGLIALPIGGELLDSTSSAAASGLYLAAVIIGGVFSLCLAGISSGNIVSF
jgi:hypothetical protein